jgi:butyryl-CoA dehydrogenase
MKKLGYRSIDTCEVVFEDVRVPAANLIGEEEGNGFVQAVGGLELGRINIAARGAGIAQGATELAVRYAQERETFGKPICKHQAIQLKLGEMATKVEAARLLIEQAADKYDSGERCDMEAGMAKYFGSEAGVFCSNEAMRIFGGYSYSVEYDIERYYRDAMLMCIGEGTNEMQRIIIAKQLIERNKI